MLPIAAFATARVGVIGDTHAHIESFQELVIPMAGQYRLENLISVGDLEISRRQEKEEPNFITDLSQLLAAHDLHLFVVPGNHDEPKCLDQYGDWQHQPVEVTPHITYLPPGLVLEWYGRRIMVLGGSYSVGNLNPDSDPRELLGEDRLELALRGAEAGVDVIVSHDCPAGIDLASWYAKALDMDFHKGDVATGLNRWKLRQVGEIAQPRIWIHGHYHIPYHDQLALQTGQLVEVVGLNCDGRAGSMCILNLASLTVTCIIRLEPTP